MHDVKREVNSQSSLYPGFVGFTLLQERSSELTKGGVGSPSPILMKLAPVVRLGLKRSLATPFWPIRPVRPAQGPPKRPFFSFLKNGFLAIFFFSQPLQKCLLWVFGRFLAPKCPVFQILELSWGSGEIWPITDFGPHGPNVFLRVAISKISSPRRRSRWVYHMIPTDRYGTRP